MAATKREAYMANTKFLLEVSQNAPEEVGWDNAQVGPLLIGLYFWSEVFL